MTDISRGTTEAPPRIGMSSPDIDPADIEAVLEVLRSGRLALGPSAEAFEARVAERAGVDHAVAVSSAPRRCTWRSARSGWDRGTRSWCLRSPSWPA